jgi:hypothetical protein
LRLGRSFQDEVDDRERSDYYGDDDDDPDADGSDHPTIPRHHKPPTRQCETLTRSWAGVAHGTPPRGMTARRAFAELLMDCEEDGTLRAVLVGMLREAEPSGPS